MYIFSNEIGSVTVDSNPQRPRCTLLFYLLASNARSLWQKLCHSHRWLTLSLPQLWKGSWWTPWEMHITIMHDFTCILRSFVRDVRVKNHHPRKSTASLNIGDLLDKQEGSFQNFVISHIGNIKTPKTRKLWRLGFSQNIVKPLAGSGSGCLVELTSKVRHSAATISVETSGLSELEGSPIHRADYTILILSRPLT